MWVHGWSVLAELIAHYKLKSIKLLSHKGALLKETKSTGLQDFLNLPWYKETMKIISHKKQPSSIYLSASVWYECLLKKYHFYDKVALLAWNSNKDILENLWMFSLFTTALVYGI